MNNAKLEAVLSALHYGSVTLEEVVPFTWTTVRMLDEESL